MDCFYFFFREVFFGGMDMIYFLIMMIMDYFVVVQRYVNFCFIEIKFSIKIIELNKMVIIVFFNL